MRTTYIMQKGDIESIILKEIGATVPNRFTLYAIKRTIELMEGIQCQNTVGE